MKSERMIKKISIIFFIIILICTFLSKTINKLLLPQVQMIDIKSGSLKSSIDSIGRVEYLNVEDITAKQGWVVKEISVNIGQNIEKGQVLARVDLSKIEELQKEKELEIMNLEYDIKAIKKSEPIDEDSLKIKQYALEIAQNQYNAISNGLNDKGEIVSNTKGIVTKVGCDKDTTLDNGNTLFEVSDSNSNYGIKWELNNQQSEYLRNGMSVNVSVEGESNIKNVPATIISNEYLEDKDVYEFTAELKRKDISNVNLELNQQVSVEYSMNSGNYNEIIPKESVVEKSDGSKVVYVVKQKEGTFGVENYIDEETVNIVGADDFDYAINNMDNDIKQVVYSSSKSISKGTEVKMENENK